MKLGICGPGRCGKDTAAEYLRDKFGLRYTHGTSRWAMNLVWSRMTQMGFSYDTPEECFEDRHNHRNLWKRIIQQHNADDKVRMYRECLAHQDILTGIRLADELWACRQAGLCDTWIWIERPGIEPDPTIEYGPTACDLVIRNDGTLADFHAKLTAFMDSLRQTAA